MQTLVTAPPRRRWPWAAAAALVLAATAAGAAWLWRPAAPLPPVTRFTTPLPEDATVSIGSLYVRLSPDGTKIAMTVSNSLWVRDLTGDIEARELTGTENAIAPFWSPDSRSLAFAQGTRLMRVDLAGGRARLLAESTTAVGSGFWTEDGEIVFGSRGDGPGLQRVPESGGVPTPLTLVAPAESFHSLPSLLPDKRRFLYLRRGADDGMYVGSLDAAPEDQPRERVLPSLVAATVVESSHPAGARVLFMNDRTLMAQPFDQRTLRLIGQPQVVAENVGTGASHAHFSVSPGVLAYRVGEQVREEQGGRALWLGRDGQLLNPVGTLGGPISALALSPDERRLVLQRRYGTDSAETDLWMLDLADGGREWTFTLSRDLPTFMGANIGPVWSPDGTQVAYTAGRRVHVKDASGAGAPRDLGVEGLPLDWTDGYLVYSNYASTLGELDIYVLPLQDRSTDVPTRALISGPGIDALPDVSPNGRWIAYASTRGATAGDVEVYIRRFRPNEADDASDTVLRVSRGGGFSPKWRADGKELFFVSPAGELLAVEIDEDADVPTPSSPVMLFTLTSNNWDVSHDGQRFIVSSFFGGDSEPDTPISVVLNWEAALAR